MRSIVTSVLAATLLATSLSAAVPRRAHAQGRAEARALEIRELREERARLSMDVPYLLGGIGGFLMAGAIATWVVADLAFPELPGSDQTTFHGMLVGGAIAFGAGAVLTIAGVVIGTERSDRRLAIDMQLDAFERAR